MIEGLKIDVSAREMSEHAASRAKFHKERADSYETKAKELEALQGEEEQGRGKMSNNNSPVQGLTESARRHRAKERFFLFASEHFVGGETYRLGWTEATQFEISPEIW